MCEQGHRARSRVGWVPARMYVSPICHAICKLQVIRVIFGTRLKYDHLTSIRRKIRRKNVEHGGVFSNSVT
jgi:hypothetical protein